MTGSGRSTTDGSWPRRSPAPGWSRSRATTHVLLEDEPAWSVFSAEVADFLRAEVVPRPRTAGNALARLTEQERAVLDRAALGLDDHAIAEEPHLSVRTVEQHLQNVYRKIGVSGTTARTAAVAAVLTAG